MSEKDNEIDQSVEGWAAAGRLPRGDVRGDMLPPKVLELIDVIGYDATMRLVEKFGGYECFIPAEQDNDHALAKLIGVVAFAKLVAYGRKSGQQLRLPRCANLVRKDLANRVGALRAKGMGHGKIALELRLSERGVRKILKREKLNANPAQGKLL